MPGIGRTDKLVRYGLAAVACVLAIFAWHHATSQAGGIEQIGSRRMMPELAPAQLGGGTWRMADHRGQVVLVNYWATWCGPCWEETPGLVRLAQELGPQGLAVVGISLDEGTHQKVQNFVDDFKVPYPVAFPAPMSQLAWGMQGVPTTILVDREGRVAKSYVGAVREQDFREDVLALLKEDGAAPHHIDQSATAIR
jgi:cytochrome c biogenesis protein CcmG/thiol:disulfide interchange protein DsbE